MSGEKAEYRFPLPFAVPNMDRPFFGVQAVGICTKTGEHAERTLPCGDLALASENAFVHRGYVLSLGDAVEEEFMRILFVPKSTSTGGKAPLDRQDYRMLKKQRTHL